MRFALIVLAACSSSAQPTASVHTLTSATCPGTTGDFLMITARNDADVAIDLCKTVDAALVRAGATRSTLHGSELTVMAVEVKRGKDSVMCFVRIELHERRRLVRAEPGIGEAPLTDDALRDANLCISGTLFRLFSRPAKS